MHIGIVSDFLPVFENIITITLFFGFVREFLNLCKHPTWLTHFCRQVFFGSINSFFASIIGQPHIIIFGNTPLCGDWSVLGSIHNQNRMRTSQRRPWISDDFSTPQAPMVSPLNSEHHPVSGQPQRVSMKSWQGARPELYCDHPQLCLDKIVGGEAVDMWCCWWWKPCATTIVIRCTYLLDTCLALLLC